MPARAYLDTPRALTDELARVVWRQASQTFGQGQIEQDPDNDGVELTFNLRFPGHYFDQESLLHYNYHRYFDPSLGRYISADPIGRDGGVNLFVYVYNNPVSFVDPLGLRFCTEHFVAHYYHGGGSAIDLASVGLLGAYRNSPSVQRSVTDFYNKIDSRAQVKAKALCKDCEEGVKSESLEVKDRQKPLVDVAASLCLFALGKARFARRADCMLRADCGARQFGVDCSIQFRIDDSFADPLDIERRLGTPYPVEAGGTPYPINASWSERAAWTSGF